jgi:hypothetical protein
MNGNEGPQQKSATFPSGTPVQPPSNGGDAEVNGVDLVPVQFPIQEQDDDVNTRTPTGPVLTRLTAILDQTQGFNRAPTSPQHDSGKDKENPGQSGSSAAHTEGPRQPPNEGAISPQNGRIPDTTLAMKATTGPFQRVIDASTRTDSISESHLEGFKRNKRDPVSDLRDAMEQAETEDEDKESEGGDYLPRSARVRLRDTDDSGEEERPKRRKRNKVKDKETEQVRDKGKMRIRKPPVPQHQIDAMIQWGLNHPMEPGANQKVYWSKFVEEVSSSSEARLMGYLLLTSK